MPGDIMNRRSCVLVISLLLMAVYLSGCMGPMTPPISPPPAASPTDFALVGSPNVIPIAPEEDPYPLFVGARWVYRNAAEDWNPSIASSGLLESEVVAEVQAKGAHCYVMRTQYSNGPGEYLYIHRTSREVDFLGSRQGTPSGALQHFSVAPGLAFLKLPLERGMEWSLLFREGSVHARVTHQEVVAIRTGTVFTLLGEYSPITTGAWRVHYELFGTAPRLFGSPMQFLWFAPGVGVLKHVMNSSDYELAEFSLREEVALLQEGDAVADAPVGGVVIVQLRGGSPDVTASGAWKLENEDPESVLASIDTAFYDDLDPVEDGGGTYVYRFRAVESGMSLLTFTRYNRETGKKEDTVQFRVRVE